MASRWCDSQPGASTTLAFHLTTEDLAAYNETTGQWTAHDGPYQISIGRSSRDLRASTEIEVESGRLTQAANVQSRP